MSRLLSELAEYVPVRINKKNTCNIRDFIVFECKNLDLILVLYQI